MWKHRHLRFVAIFCLLFSGCCYIVDAQTKTDVKIGAAADIIFLVDSSWSIGKEHFQLVREFLYDVVKQLDVGENDFRFGLVQFSGNPHTEFQLNTYHSMQDILSHISHMTYIGGGTKTGEGLEFLIQNHLTKVAGSRASDGVPQIIIVLTDGRSQDDVVLPSYILKSADVNMFAIGVQDAVERELKEIASEPLDTHLFNLENFAALHGIIGDLVASVHSSVTPEMAGANGVIKDITAQESADLIFLIDGSNSVGTAAFSAFRDFLANFIERLSVGAEQIHVGVVMYSDRPRTVFTLDQHTNNTDVLDAIKALSFPGGEEANMGEALEYVVQNHFTRSGGSRVEEGVPQVLVLISGSESSDDIREGVLALKRAKVFAFCIGVRNADMVELQHVATDGSFVFFALDTRSFDELQELLLPNIAGVAQRLILLDAPTILTEVTEANQKDIVFLIDGTTIQGNVPFNGIRDFLSKIINRLDVGADKIQVAVVQYSDNVRPEISFRTTQDKTAIVSSVRKLRPLGGSVHNTGSALRYVKENLFTRDEGCRIEEGILPLLVLITGGKSRDDVALPAQELKGRGILAVALGALNADRAELEQVASGPSLVFIATDFRQVTMQSLIPDVLSHIRTLSGILVETTTEVLANKRDIIFLLDGSVNVGNANFPFVRDLVVSLVKFLEVGIDDIRIGLVQFSENPKTEFFLNTFLTKSDVLNRLSQLRLQGGSVLNVGSALDFVLSNHFTEAGGSRIDEKVPQVLVFLAAGPSADSFQQAANALARAGVLTFCIGVRNAVQAELQKIAFNPQMVYLKDDFSSLAALPQDMIRPLTTYVSGDVEEVTIPLAERKQDILFLTDGSANVAGQFSVVREFLSRIISDLDVKPEGIRVAVAQFSDNVQLEFNFEEIPAKADIVTKVKKMKMKSGRPLNIGAALDYALNNIFVRNAGSRIDEGVPQFLVLLAAGRSSDNVEPAADALKQANIVPFVIKSKNAYPAELEKIVYDPHFILNADSLARIGDVQPKIVNLLKSFELAPRVVVQKKDVVFLIDGSDGNRRSFPALLTFVENIVQSLNVGPDNTRVAVAQYSNVPKVEFLLNAHPDKASVISAVRRLSPMGGSPLNTGAALSSLLRSVFVSRAGSRVAEGVPQFLILVTADKSRDDITRPAVALKGSGAVPFGIGYGNADATELRTISFVPDFAVLLPDVRQLSNVQQQIADRVVRLTREEIEAMESILVPPTTVVVQKKDVVFLIDGSDGNRRSFPALLTFVENIVQSLNVGPDDTRVAVAQYSNVPKVEFLLNAHPDKASVISAVRRLSPMGGSPLNTGAALSSLLRSVFVSRAGSRVAEGVPQFLILVTADKSRDDVTRPAVALKGSGAVPFGIGYGNADATELRTISFVPDFAVLLPDVRQLSNVQQQIADRVVRLTREEIEAMESIIVPPTTVDGKRDIVFLVDGSDFAAPEFASVRDFIKRLVTNLNVDADATRVAVIQFSDNAKPEFLLNAHSSKDEVQEAVTQIRPKGGWRVNVGSALEYVSRNIFTRPSGSRIEEGAPQFLILLFSRPSDDEVEGPAIQVKQIGVAPLAVAKNVDSQELVRIALSPEYVFQVSSYQDLPSLEKQLLTPVTTLTTQQIQRLIGDVRRPPGIDPEAKDIVFLIDSSTDVGRDNIAYIRDFIVKFIQKLDVGENKVRIALVQFSNDVFPEFLLRDFKSKSEVLGYMQRLRHRGGAPLNVGKALDYVVKNVFVKPAGSRREDGVPQHLVLLLGGRSRDDVSLPSSALQGLGIKSLGVGVKNADSAEMERITGAPRTVFFVREFTELPAVERRFFASLLQLPEPPTEPEVPVVDGKKQADIVFVLDSSINFGKDNFQKVTDFVAGVVDALYEEGDSIQVGLVQYNSDVNDEFFLKDFSNKEQIIEAIEKVAYKGGRVSNAGAAIKHVQAKHFVKEAGSRADQKVPQIAFLITGGRPDDDGSAAALSLARTGTKVFAVGVKGIDLGEIAQLSSDSTTAFRARDAVELSDLNEAVLVTMVDVMRQQLCQVVGEVSRECNLDIILGFDVSDVGPQQSIFTAQRVLETKVEDILNRITQIQRISCTPGQAPSVRVALLAQTRSGVVEAFDFSEYQPELFEKFQAIHTRGPFVLTADTLKSYQSKFATAPAGNVKVVIHLTDGIDGSKEQLRAASADLKREGVKAFILVGLERVANFEDVMQLEFGRGFTYNRPLRVNLLDLDFELAEQLDNVAERACCGVPCKCSGQRGDRGAPGRIGPKGAPGENGYRGYPGDEGGPGDRGPLGINGTQGFQGCPGERGAKGNRGFPGEKGELGEIGLDGIDGEEGDKGHPGSPGERGNPGRRGDKGGKGEQGERGDRGLRGNSGAPGADSTQRGPRGQKGELGPMGDPGADGPAGPPGGPGRNGGQGRRGPPGIKGNRGTPGPQGSVGEQGTRGPQGPPGQAGTPGLLGEQGIPGPRGGGGPPGAAGERGRPGPLGRKGEPGDAGPKGIPGPVGPRGEAGDDGRDGVGRAGAKGRRGEPGFPGYPGPKGVPGDRGGAGDPGPKGNRGLRGTPGEPGMPGQKGERGYGGPTGHKGDRGESRDQCALVRNIKDKCPCCYGPRECPIYPTELAFAIDTSSGVGPGVFNRMRQAVLAIVNDLTIAESNCPRGARVALVTYNNEVTTEIRFADSRKKAKLLKQIEALRAIQTTKQRSLETAMSFVARNTFKRARSGFLMRKVAVFFSNGPTRASPQLNEAMLKLYDAGVVPVFLTSQDDRALANALQINNSIGGQVITFSGGAGQINQTIRRVITCHICLDVCDPDPGCGPQRPAFGRDRRAAPTDVDIDIAFILDSSESTTPLQFREMKKYIAYIISQLEISPDPKASLHHARVAVIQHAPYEYASNSSASPVKIEVSLTDYGSKDKLMDFTGNQMVQLQGTRALASAIEYTTRLVFEQTPNPRDLKVIVLMITGEVETQELERLQRVVVEAKCKGYFFVILGIGRQVNIRSLYSLASEPNDVFFKYADKPSELHEEPLLRFGNLLPSFISSENAFYLSPDIRKQCDWFQGDQPVKKSAQRSVNIPNNVTAAPTTTKATTKATATKTITKATTTKAATTEATTKPTTTKTTTTTKPPPPTEKLEVVMHTGEVQVTDITENSAKLQWVDPEPQHTSVYDVTITLAHDHSLVLKLNLTGTERVIGGLRSGQKYHILVRGYRNAQARSTYTGTFSTKAVPLPKLPSPAITHLMVNTEPLEEPKTDPCLLDLDMGTQCKEYQVKWFFDYKNKICTQVWYGGCGGNANRFETEADCISRCLKPSEERSMPLPVLEKSHLSVTGICNLKKEEGTCRNFVLKWYYDPETRSCARFWYGGCGGNENRFNTQRECENVCISAHVNPGVVTTVGT